MLRAWIEVLPLFIVRRLALRLCERMPMQREGHTRSVVCPRPGVYIVDAAARSAEQKGV
jgi:hypothetical protein